MPKITKQIFALQGSISASIDQQIIDAVYSGSMDYQDLQVQFASSSIQAVSTSILSQSAQNAQEELSANAIINSLPNIIRSAIGQGNSCAEMLEITGSFTSTIDVLEAHPILIRLRKKCTNHGLKFRVLPTTTGSWVACVKLT